MFQDKKIRFGLCVAISSLVEHAEKNIKALLLYNSNPSYQLSLLRT